MSMYLIYQSGRSYRAICANRPLAKCYRCDLYEACPKKTEDRPCLPFKENVYFKEVPVECSYAPDWNDFDFSTKFVKYKGKRIDKCEVKTHIRTAAHQLGNTIWPLLTDIYWYDMKYEELKKDLENKVYLLRALITAKHTASTSE